MPRCRHLRCKQEKCQDWKKGASRELDQFSLVFCQWHILGHQLCLKCVSIPLLRAFESSHDHLKHLDRLLFFSVKKQTNKQTLKSQNLIKRLHGMIYTDYCVVWEPQGLKYNIWNQLWFLAAAFLQGRAGVKQCRIWQMLLSLCITVLGNAIFYSSPMLRNVSSSDFLPR